MIRMQNIKQRENLILRCVKKLIVNNHFNRRTRFTKTDTSPEFSIPKAPVELQNFRSQSLLQHPGSEKKSNSFRFPLLVQNEEVDIDKYGFVKEFRSIPQ